MEPRAPWTRRLLAIMTVLFILMTFDSGSLFLPDEEYLIAWGAKDPQRIAAGEYWRLFTAMFLHIGVIHFLLNTYALKVIGRYLEVVLGGSWFLLIFLTTGVVGNIVSYYLDVTLSAGASGAIFGLIGCGMVLEYRVRSRAIADGYLPNVWRACFGGFAYVAFINIALALGLNAAGEWANIPVRLDNAAHLGGMFAGIFLGILFTKRVNVE